MYGFTGPYPPLLTLHCNVVFFLIKGEIGILLFFNNLLFLFYVLFGIFSKYYYKILQTCWKFMCIKLYDYVTQKKETKINLRNKHKNVSTIMKASR